MKRFLKKGMAALLSVVMVVTAAPQLAKEVHAAENQLPTKEQFATVEELKSFNTNDNDGAKNPAKVYFGNNSQQWWIAGSQQEQGLTLFAASPLATNQVFESDAENNKTYRAEWKCGYIGTGDSNPTDVYPNHYGASPLRKTLESLETSYFTDVEQNLMNDTTIYTHDTKNNSVYSTTNKLYLAYGDNLDHQYIVVGTNSPDALNKGLRIEKTYWAKAPLWLRAPDLEEGVFVSAADPGYCVHSLYITNGYALVSAFELNLSSVLFASAARAASSNGSLDIKTVNNKDIDGAFTVRYDASKHSKNLGSALVSYDKSKVTLTGVPDGTYLVVQNSTGAKAKQITNETEVSAKDDFGLDSFANSKVWLETTDTVNRITYATMAEEEKETAVNITVSTGLNITSNNSSQELAPNTAIAHITVEVTDGYYLPDDYISNLQTLAWNGLSVTKTDNGFTITGIPTSDVSIILPAARKEHFVVEGGKKGTDYTYEKGVITFLKDGDYTVVGDGTVTSDRIIVGDNVTGSLTLKNININTRDSSCLEVKGTANLTIWLEGKNTLCINGHDPAALQFENVTTGSLIIDSKSNGELIAVGWNGAGIGGSMFGAPKNLIIRGGSIDATSYRSSNGIGKGWYSSQDSEITIEGGIISSKSVFEPNKGLGGTENSLITIKGGYVNCGITGNAVISGGYIVGDVSGKVKNNSNKELNKVDIPLVMDEVKEIWVDDINQNINHIFYNNPLHLYLAPGKHKVRIVDNNGNKKVYNVSDKVDGNDFIELPTNLSATYTKNLKLSDIDLSNTDWTWVNADTVLCAGTRYYPASYDTSYLDSMVNFSGVEGYDEVNHRVIRDIEVNVSSATNVWIEGLLMENWTYGEQAKTPKAKAKFGDVTFIYSSEENGIYTDKVPTNAGTWYVKATVAETENYTGLESDPVQFKITSADSDITITSEKDTYVYEDQITLDVSVNLAKKLSFFERLFTNDNTVTAYVGDTAISSSVELDKNNHATLTIDTKDEQVRKVLKPSDQKLTITVKYNGSENLNNTKNDISIMLQKKDTTVSFDTAFNLSRVYNGKSVTVDVENDIHKTKNAPEVTLNWNTEDGTALDTAPLKAGKYQLIVSIPEDAYYKGSSVQHNFEISKAELSVAVKVKDKQYDGFNTAEIESAALVGVAEGDQITLINGTPTFDSVEEGENIAIHFTEFTLEAEEDVLNNYTLIQPTGVTASITNTWIPTKDVEYTTSQPNGNGWLKEDFKIQAKEGYLLALGNKADGSRSVNWNKELAGSEEGANSIAFYVKNVKTGAISTQITVPYKLDKTKPQVNGLEKDKVYCKEITFTVEETNLDVVKANEKDLTPNEKGVYTLTAGNHRIIVMDQAGNETVLAVTVNAEHTPNADDSDCTTPITCAVCGTVVKEAQEHSFTTYTSDSNAGCLTDGTKTAECDHEGCVQTKTVAEEGSALGHDWGEWETVTSPDCENKGSEKRTCKRCSVTETKDLEASGHDWEEEFTVDQEATCTEEGSKSIHCKKCDAVKDSTSIPATGHAYGKPKWNWNEDGKTVAVTFICQNDSSHVETKTAEVTSAVKEPATCTQAGITTYTATVSFEGNVYTDTKDVADIEALGHDWEEKYTVDKEATCTEEGSKSIHCKNCDETKDNTVLPTTGHKYVHGVCAICEAKDPNYKEHEIADGNGSSWNKGDENGLSVQTPGVIGKITDVILSGKPLVEGADYVVNDGTVILKPNVLKELKEGNHTLTIYGEKGYVETQIKIEQNATLVPQNPGNTAKPEKPEDKDPNQETGSPKTGDYANLALWFGLLFASIGSASVTYFYKKKKRN